jgi:hypothetical protein
VIDAVYRAESRLVLATLIRAWSMSPEGTGGGRPL